MKKIGLLLTSGPSDGGMFQYGLAILTALFELPEDEFHLVLAYIDPVWQEYLPPKASVRLPLSPGKIATAAGPMWVASGLSLDLWQRWAPRFHRVVKEVVRQACDLWVFPRQDIWSSQFPVAALAAVHDLMHRYESSFPEVSSRGRYRFREIYLGHVCRSAKGILVDSELGKRQVHESYGTPLEQLFVLPYVPPSYIYEDRTSPDFQERYKLPSKYLFYPAQFWLHKNHNRLISAVAKAKEDFPDICLVLAGSTRNHHRAVLHQVEKLGLQQNVFFLGYVPEIDMPELYRRARALVLPTFFGPTNIPPLEAFALGCPVAASRIYATPDQVGDAALLFDPNSTDEIASCIRRLWSDDDLCRLLIASGKRRAAAWGQPEFSRALHSIIRQLTSRAA